MPPDCNQNEYPLKEIQGKYPVVPHPDQQCWVYDYVLARVHNKGNPGAGDAIFTSLQNIKV